LNGTFEIRLRTVRPSLSHGFARARPIAGVEPLQRHSDDGAMEEATRRWRGQQRADLPAAARLTKDRDVARIAAEAPSIVSYPLQRSDHLESAGVAGRGKVLAAKIAEIHVTKNVEALIDRYHDDVVSLGQVCAIKPRCIGGPVAEAAAVEPHHDGTPAAVVEAARPDVDDQAFLGFRAPVRPSRKGA
jgi:hypothetical protein